MNKNLVIALLVGQLVGLLGFLDPVYVVLVLAGPLLTGAVAAARRLPLVLPVVLWVSAGLNMLWVDWVFRGEDVAYHLVLSAVMALLAALGHGIVSGVARWRRRSEPLAQNENVF